MILLTFVFFILAAALIMLISLNKEGYDIYALPMIGAGILIFIIFWIQLERGYFDYIRKIRDYVKKQST